MYLSWIGGLAVPFVVEDGGCSQYDVVQVDGSAGTKDGAMPRERFVSEPIEVDVSSVPVAGLGRGAPTCPGRFVWRGDTYVVTAVLETGKQVRAHDSSETYVKSHSFRVHTDRGLEMVLRCDRQVRGNPWRVYTVKELG